MLLAKQRKHWPRFPLPEVRGNITVVNVVAAPPGAARDEAIEKWCRSVWDAWRRSREQVVQLVEDESHGVQKKSSQKS